MKSNASEQSENVSTLRISEGKRDQIEEVVVREFPLTIILNNQELVTLLCSPAKMAYLATGFLASEGLVKSKEDIKSLVLDDQRGIVRVETTSATDTAEDLVFKRFITSGCGKGTAFYSAIDAASREKITSETTLSATQVLTLMREFQNRSELFKTTGGVHSAALADASQLIIFGEDIGRHNAIDKIFGECLLEGIPSTDRVIVTSGRISSEILFKVAKRGVPMIISKSAPTDLAVRTATDLGITLVGFVRGKRMNVYANPWRISG